MNTTFITAVVLVILFAFQIIYLGMANQSFQPKLSLTQPKQLH